MYRSIMSIVVLSTLVLAIGACSHSESTTAPSQFDKKAGNNIEDPPEGFDPFLAQLALALEEIEWVTTEITMSRTEGGSISFVPVGYPESLPLVVHLEGNPNALGDGGPDGCTFFFSVPARPPFPETLHIPGDCLPVRTKGFPPPNTGTAVLDVPVMPWYSTENFTGFFRTYELIENESGYAATQNEGVLNVVWPPVSSGEPLYLTASPSPGTDGNSNAILYIFDRDEPEI